MIRYPCPNCNDLRRALDDSCDACGWPHGARPYLLSRRLHEPWRFQFRLRSAFLLMTVACGQFALIGQFGVGGFVERCATAMLIASLFSPLLALYGWWRRSGLDDVM